MKMELRTCDVDESDLFCITNSMRKEICQIANCFATIDPETALKRRREGNFPNFICTICYAFVPTTSPRRYGMLCNCCGFSVATVASY